MTTVRIVLKEPFMKYPAGTVFELNEAQGISGWDPDERLRDRQSFSDKRTFYLPDMGRGRGVDLPASMTIDCPEGIFEGQNLNAGPCRITQVSSGTGENLQPWTNPVGLLRENDVTLCEINGIAAQGLQINLPAAGNPPEKILVKDILREVIIREIPLQSTNQMANPWTLDFSELAPGFYQLSICYPGDARHAVQFVKSFPFLVVFKNNWSYTLQKTLY